MIWMRSKHWNCWKGFAYLKSLSSEVNSNLLVPEQSKCLLPNAVWIWKVRPSKKQILWVFCLKKLNWTSINGLWNRQSRIYQLLIYIIFLKSMLAHCCRERKKWHSQLWSPFNCGRKRSTTIFFYTCKQFAAFKYFFF